MPSAAKSQGWVEPDSGMCCFADDHGGAAVLDLRSGDRMALDGDLAREALEGCRGPLAIGLAGSSATWRRFAGAARTAVPLEPGAVLAAGGWGRLFVELTGRCNERCLHCYAGSGPEVEDALSPEEVRAAVDDASALGFRDVQFTGGDPLLCGELPAHVAHATGSGLKVEVYTNGLLLSDALLDRFGDGRPAFAFSVYSHDPAAHDRVTRVPGSQRRTAAAIGRVVARGLDARVGIIVMPENEGGLEATVAWVEALGVPRDLIGWDGSRAVGRGTRYRGDLPRAEASTHGRDAPEDTAAEDTAGRGRRRGKACVASTGIVYPCIFQRWLPLGSIRERPLREILKRPALPPGERGWKDDVPAERLACLDCQARSMALMSCADRTGGATAATKATS